MKSLTVSIVSPSIWHEVIGPDAMILVFWMLSFKPVFSLSFFTFIKRIFSYSLSAIRVVSSVYLRWLIFLPEILIPACASLSQAFRIMYCAYKLNKQDDYIQPWHTPFLIWNQSVFPCSVLAVASWPAHRFVSRQVRLSGIPISFLIEMFKIIQILRWINYGSDTQNGWLVIVEYGHVSVSLRIGMFWTVSNSRISLVIF